MSRPFCHTFDCNHFCVEGYIIHLEDREASSVTFSTISHRKYAKRSKDLMFPMYFLVRWLSSLHTVPGDTVDNPLKQPKLAISNCTSDTIGINQSECGQILSLNVATNINCNPINVHVPALSLLEMVCTNPQPLKIVKSATSFPLTFAPSTALLICIPEKPDATCKR